MNFKQQKPPKKEEVEKSVGRNSLEEVEPTVNGEEDVYNIVSVHAGRRSLKIQASLVA